MMGLYPLAESGMINKINESAPWAGGKDLRL